MFKYIALWNQEDILQTHFIQKRMMPICTSGGGLNPKKTGGADSAPPSTFFAITSQRDFFFPPRLGDFFLSSLAHILRPFS